MNVYYLKKKYRKHKEGVKNHMRCEKKKIMVPHLRDVS